jgi:hypothetical protein
VRAETQPNSIVGRYEIASIVGVSRQGVASVVDHPDFPPPICFQGKHKAPLFFRRDVERFAKERSDAAEREQRAAAAAA